MKGSTPSRCILAIALLITTAGFVQGSQLQLSIAEVAQEADLIFIGTVESQIGRFNDGRSMILTDVTLTGIRVVHAKDRSIQKRHQKITLTYAGGTVGLATIKVSDAPSFENGGRYLIFLSDDGKVYGNPIVGAHQGVFHVIKDNGDGEEYMLTSGRKAIVGIDAEGIVTGKKIVSRVENGTPIEDGQESLPDRVHPEVPNPASPADSSSSQLQLHRSPVVVQKPMKTEQFLDYIVKVALAAPLTVRQLRSTGQGHFHIRNGSEIEVKELALVTPPLRTFRSAEEDSEKRLESPFPLIEKYDAASTPGRSHSAFILQGGQTGACGYQTLPLVMQQVPTSFWSFQINNDCMFTWNQFMDIYRYIDSDGFYGNNDQNEFAAFVNDADVFRIYGFHWGSSALAVTVIYMDSGEPQCGKLSQTDVLWNAAYSWTDDAEFAIANPNVILLRPVAMHELGHTWGSQIGAYPETYDYDVVTVMHAYYSNLVEDGWGIHWADAYLIRRQYDNQTTIRATRDVGVESYYASNGLKKSTTNASSYNQGQSITLNNVTVENMSFSAVSDVRIRFFLSTNRIVSTADYQMGSYWFWTSFPAENYNVSSYTTTIPSNIPPGTYYIGAMITINGFGSDDFVNNNTTTFLDTVTINPAPDITSPTISITSPTSNPTFGTGSNSVNLGGVASDNLGVTQVSWANNRGGSGAATGTTNWTVNGVTLQSGSNVITLTARDGAGNTGTDSITVTYTANCPPTGMFIGQTINGSLASTDCLSPLEGTGHYADRFTFPASAGQQVAVSLTSSAFDTLVFLLRPDGATLQRDDDGGGGTNSRIPAQSGFLTLPTTGTYTIEATSFFSAAPGAYSLSLTGGASPTGDTDGDGMPDSVEVLEGTNPLVKDNEVFNNARRFVMQQYRDFLGREGDPNGIAGWTSAITSGSLTRSQVIGNGFFGSQEFQGTVSPIVRLYFAYFLRIPDYAGLQSWLSAYRAGASLATISEGFAQSPEFIQRYGNLSNSAFVSLLYQNVLGRAPDPNGLASWTNALNSGATRGAVMLGFSESTEFKAKSNNNVFVSMTYIGMLRRSPDQAGFDNWVAALDSGASGLQIIQGFLGSLEYHNRFLP